MTPTLQDLRAAFYGRGPGESVDDAEYEQLLELYGQGQTLERMYQLDSHRSFPAIMGRLGGGAVLHASLTYPRVTFPDGVDSSVCFGPFGFSDLFYDKSGNASVVSGFEYVNDHNVTTGNIRFRFRVRSCDEFLTDIATPVLEIDQTWNNAGSTVPVGKEGIIVPPAGSPFTIVKGPLGTKYSIMVERLGSDGVNDTFTGPIGITTEFLFREF
jgi:hypothetical protein